MGRSVNRTVGDNQLMEPKDRTSETQGTTAAYDDAYSSEWDDPMGSTRYDS